MVAVVAGQFSGLFHASQLMLGSASHGQASQGVYVNAATGNLVMQGQDSNIAGLGADFANLRTYNSLGDFGDDVGNDNWRLGFLSELRLSAGSINTQGSLLTRITGDGSEQSFTYNSESQRYESTQGAGADDYIVVNALTGTATYTEGSSLVDTTYSDIRSTGRVTSKLDRDSHGYHYNYQGNTLSTIDIDTDTGIETLTFVYDGNDRLSELSIANGDKYTYLYDAQGRLEHVQFDLTPEDDTDQSFYNVTYTYYGTTDRLKSIEQSDNTYIEFEYDVQSRVTTVTNGIGDDAQTTRFDYTNEDTTKLLLGKQNNGQYEQEIELTFNDDERLLSQTSVVDNQQISISYTYDDQGNVETVTNDLGQTTHYTYHNGLIESEQNAEGYRVERTYNDDNQILTETRFAMADPDGYEQGQSASEPQTTYYVYDNKRLTYVISEQGRVTAYQYDNFGLLDNTLSYTKATYKSNDFTHASLTSWQNALTGHSDDWAQKTQYTYDFRGQVAQVRQYQSVSAAGVFDEDNTVTTQFQYDLHGRLRTETMRNETVESVTSYVYDPLNRLTQKSISQTAFVTADNPAPVSEIVFQENYVYQDGQSRIGLSSGQNGAYITTTYDSAGRVLSQVQGDLIGESNLGRESFEYDGVGREIVHHHANGAISYTFYDNAGRISHTVDQTGAMIAYEYDSANRETSRHAYATLLDTSSWYSTDTQVFNQALAEQAISLASSDAAKDRVEYTYYNDAGQVAFRQDAAGFVTELKYNGLGQVTHTIAYAKPSDVSFNGAGHATIHSIDGARVERQLYNQDGLVSWVIDGDGYASEYQYDGAGQKVAIRQYANAITVSGSSASTAQLIALVSDIDFAVITSAADKIERFAYNGAGLLSAYIDGQGKASQYQYDINGQLSQTIEYRTRQINQSTTGILTLPSTSLEDRVTQYSYNGLGKVESQTQGTRALIINADSTGLVTITSFNYDDKGQLIGTQVSEQSSDNSGLRTETDTRHNLVGRDALGRVVGELNGKNFDDANLVWDSVSVDTIASTLINDGTSYVFANNGRLLSETDNEGRVTYFFYDVKDRLTATINSAGQVKAYEYNAFDQVTSTKAYISLAVNAVNTLDITAINGNAHHTSIVSLINSLGEANQVQTTYTKRGLVDTVDKGGQSYTDNDYNAFGELSQQTSQLSSNNTRVDNYGYDNRGHLTLTTVDSNTLALSTVHTFDAFGRVKSSTNQQSTTTHYEYNDALGQVVTLSVSANGTEQSSVAYDVFGREVIITDASNRTTTYRYDDSQKTQLIEHGSREQGTRLSFNGFGELVEMRKGKITDTSVAQDGSELDITDANVEAYTRYTFDKNGNQLTVVEGLDNQITMTYQYNDENQRISQTLSGERELTTQYYYDDAGHLSAVQNADGSVSRYGYDGSGQQTFVLAADNSLTIYYYDSAGRQVATTQLTTLVTSELSAFISQYNQANGTDHSKLTIPLSQADIDDWLLANANAQVTNYTILDDFGRQTYVIDAEGGVTHNVYDARGLVIEQVRYATPISLDNATQTQLKTGQLTSLPAITTSDADRHTKTFYNALGLAQFSVEHMQTGKVRIKESQYDEAGRLMATRAYAQPVALTLAEIDASTDLTQYRSDKDRQSWLLYDGAGRVRYSVNEQGYLTENTYNSAGQLIRQIDYKVPLSSVSEMPTTLRDSFSSGTMTTAQLDTYLPVESADDRITNTVYTGAGQIKRITDALEHTESWAYFDNGLKASYTDKRGETWHYTYDAEGQLAREVGPSLKEVLVDAGNNQYQTLNNVRLVKSFTYDAMGNVSTSTSGYITDSAVADFATVTVLAPMIHTFTYDSLGRQIFSGQPEAVGSPSTSSVVTFDGLGNAVVNQIITGDGSIYTYKIYDALGMLTHDIDALGYVTEYTYDALDQQVAITRYGQPLDLDAIANWQAGNALSLADIAMQLDTINDKRTIITEYNALGQKMAVTQPQVSVSRIQNDGSVTSYNASPVTTYTYTQYGELATVTEAISTQESAITQYFYDNLGRRSYMVDALGYVSEWQYDEFDQVASYIEYADAMTDVTHRALKDLSPRASQSDRQWIYEYDKLGQRTHESQINLSVFIFTENSGASGNDISVYGTSKLSESQATALLVTEYDGAGNIVKVTDKGDVTGYKLDAMGRVVSMSGPQTETLISDTQLHNGWSAGDFHQTQLTTEKHYDVYGNVARVVSGNSIVGTGDEATLSLEVGENRVNQQFFNARGQLVSTIDAQGHQANYEYDHAGRLIRQENIYQEAPLDYVYSLQLVKTFSDDGFGVRSETVTLPDWLSFDSQSGILTSTKAVSFNGYDEMSVLLSVSDKDGNLIKSYGQFYLTDGQTVNKQYANWAFASVNGDDKTAVSKFLYDDAGQQVSVERFRLDNQRQVIGVDARQESLYNGYGELIFRGDSADSLFTATQAQPLQEYFKYNAAGQLIESNSGNGVATYYRYDLQGNVVQQSSVTEGATSFSYDKLGRMETQHQAGYYVGDSRTTINQTFDRWGNLTSRTDANGYTINYEYNAQNLLEQEIRPLVNAVDEQGDTFTLRPTFKNYYDVKGRLIASEDSLGHFKIHQYTAVGQLSQSFDELGNVTSRAYNVYGEQVATQHANGYVTSNKVNLLGQVIETGDIRLDVSNQLAYQKLNDYEYDSLGNRILQRNALGNEYYSQFNSQGQVIFTRSPEGVGMSYEYDVRGNQTSLSYDKLSNGELGNISRIYDYFGRLVTVNDLGGNKYDYRYENGQQISQSIDLGNDDNANPEGVISYTYYANGKVKRITNSENKSYTEFTYDATGKVKTEERYVVNAIGELTHEETRMFYDSNNRLHQVLVLDGRVENENKVLSGIEYSYDEMGNRRSMRVLNGYTGSIVLNENTAPTLNPAFEGLEYYPASTGFRYEYDLGEVANVFFDAEGDELNFELVAYPLGIGESLPENGVQNPVVDPDDISVVPYFRLNESYLQGSPAKLVVESIGNVSDSLADKDVYFAIKATESKTADGHFTLLPIVVPVRKDLSPRFKEGNDFGDVPRFVGGEAYGPLIFDLKSLIEDPEEKKLSFEVSSITLSNNVEGNIVPDISNWLVVEYNSLTTELIVRTPDGVKVPKEIFGEQATITIRAFDGVKEGIFKLNIKSMPFEINIPDSNIFLRQNGIDELDLFSLIEGDTENIIFEVIDNTMVNSSQPVLEFGGQLLRSESVNNIISIVESANIDIPIRELSVNVYLSEEAGNRELLREFQIALSLDAKPRIPSDILTNLTVKFNGVGSFTFPPFEDINNDELIYIVKYFSSNLSEEPIVIPMSDSPIIGGGSGVYFENGNMHVNYPILSNANNGRFEIYAQQKLKEGESITDVPISETHVINVQQDTPPIVSGTSFTIHETGSGSSSVSIISNIDYEGTITKINVKAINAGPPKSLGDSIDWLMISNNGDVTIDFLHSIFNGGQSIVQEFFVEVIGDDQIKNEFLNNGDTFTVTAHPIANNKPVVSLYSGSVPNNIDIGQSVAFEILVSDLDSAQVEELALEIEKPSWLNYTLTPFNTNGSGKSYIISFSGRPTSGQHISINNIIRIAATDMADESGEISYTINVNNPVPDVIEPVSRDIQKGIATTLSANSFVIVDDGFTAPYTVTVLDGSGYTRTGNTVTVTTTSSFVTVNLYVEDSFGASKSDTATFRVNTPPRISIPASGLGRVGEDFNQTWYFYDTSPDNLSINLQQINNSLPQGLTASWNKYGSEPNEWALNISGTPEVKGSPSVSYTVSDLQGGVLTGTINFEIRSAIPVINGYKYNSVEKDKPFTLNINDLYVNDDDSINTLIFEVESASNAEYSVQGNTITAISDGGTDKQIHVAVKVTDPDGNFATKTLVFNVNVPPIGSGIPKQSVFKNEPYDKLFTFVDPNSSSLNLKSISGLPTGLNYNFYKLNTPAGEPIEYALRIFGEPTVVNNYYVSYVIEDDQGAELSGGFEFDVRELLVAPSLRANGEVVGRGKIESGKIIRYQSHSTNISMNIPAYFTDVDGDPSKIKIVSVTHSSLSINAARDRVIGTSTDFSSGSHDFTVVVEDEDGLKTSATVVMHMDTPPKLQSGASTTINIPQGEASSGTTIYLNSLFEDDGGDSNLTYYIVSKSIPGGVTVIDYTASNTIKIENVSNGGQGTLTIRATDSYDPLNNGQEFQSTDITLTLLFEDKGGIPLNSSFGGDDLLANSTEASLAQSPTVFSSFSIEESTIQEGSTQSMSEPVSAETIEIVGTDGDDTWDHSAMTTPISYLGGKGNDTFIGGGSTTTYYFNLGDGHDVIDDQGDFNDRIILGEGILPENVVAEVHGEDLTLKISSSDSITVKGWYSANGWEHRIEYIDFADGTTWGQTTLGNRTTIIGTDGDDNWDHSAMTTPISYLGGKGNDTIIGGENTTTYYFNLGDGHDVIDDQGDLNDRIILGEGILPENVVAEVHGEDLTLKISSSDSITVKGWYSA
ncbi:calcium-binding protein, partial [Colwellia sp. MEBiC06753]